MKTSSVPSPAAGAVPGSVDKGKGMTGHKGKSLALFQRALNAAVRSADADGKADVRREPKKRAGRDWPEKILPCAAHTMPRQAQALAMEAGAQMSVQRRTQGQDETDEKGPMSPDKDLENNAQAPLPGDEWPKDLQIVASGVLAARKTAAPVLQTAGCKGQFAKAMPAPAPSGLPSGAEDAPDGAHAALPAGDGREGPGHSHHRGDAPRLRPPGEWAGDIPKDIAIMQQKHLPPVAAPVVREPASVLQGASRQLMQALQDALPAAAGGVMQGPLSGAGKVVRNLEIHLHPAHLGPVMARLAIHGADLEVTITIADKRLADHMRHGLDQLVRRLRAHDHVNGQTIVRIIADPAMNAQDRQASFIPDGGRGHPQGQHDGGFSHHQGMAGSGQGADDEDRRRQAARPRGPMAEDAADGPRDPSRGAGGSRYL